MQKKRCWVSWEISCIWQKRKKVKHLRIVVQQTETKKKKKELENCRKELNELYSQNKHQYINGKIWEVESVYKGQAKKCGK